MPILFSFLLIAGLIMFPRPSLAQSDIHVLRDGNYWAHSFDYPVATQSWFSVSGKEIKKVTVRLKDEMGLSQYERPRLKPGEHYGISRDMVLKSTAPKDSSFLISGLNLKEGPIDAKTYPEEGGPKFPLRIKMGGHSYTIKRSQEEPAKLDTALDSTHRLEITRDGAPTLVQIATANRDDSGYGFGVTWIGDINGDGFPDLFLFHDPGGKGQISGIYLSNLKTKTFDVYLIPYHGC